MGLERCLYKESSPQIDVFPVVELEGSLGMVTNLEWLGIQIDADI